MRIVSILGLRKECWYAFPSFQQVLKHGVSLETVSMLLGHASDKVTEKHYKPWVKTLQDRLEADAMKAWPKEPRTTGRRQTRRKCAKRASDRTRRPASAA